MCARLRPMAHPSWVQLTRPKRPPKMFPTGVNELGVVNNPLYLALRRVTAYIVFLYDVVQTLVLAHAMDDVLENLLLALVTGGVAERHPLE